MAKLRVSDRAWIDLQDIGDYIHRSNPARAATFVEEIVAKFSIITEHPRGYRARPELAFGLRAARHGRYLIYFRLRDDVVEIARVLHGARNISSIMREDQ